MSDAPALLLHFTLLFALPPLLPGVINKTKAWFAGRRGPPVLQLYYDLFRLFRKGMVLSQTTTWIFRAGPVVTTSAVLLAGSLVPFGAFDAPVRFAGDLVLFAYLLALGRFFTTAAGNLQNAGAKAGVKRIVVISIIGIDKFKGGYNAAKVAQEKAMLVGPVPVQIVRSAQFHELVERMIG